jgi:hypothetical protein
LLWQPQSTLHNLSTPHNPSTPCNPSTPRVHDTQPVVSSRPVCDSLLAFYATPCAFLVTLAEFLARKKIFTLYEMSSLSSWSISSILATPFIVLSESKVRLPAVSRKSPTTLASPRFQGSFSSIEPRVTIKSSIDLFIGFILYVTFCILHSVVVSSTSPQRGDSLSDPSPSVSKVRLLASSNQVHQVSLELSIG